MPCCTFGNVFEVILGPGEQIDVEPGAWIYKDPVVQMELEIQGLATGFFASGGQVFFNRFTGPGRVGIQSMYYHLRVAGEDGKRDAVVGSRAVGVLIRGAIDNR